MEVQEGYLQEGIIILLQNLIIIGLIGQPLLLTVVFRVIGQPLLLTAYLPEEVLQVEAEVTDKSAIM